MEEGGFQFEPGISVRFTASPESPDIDWDGLDQVPLPGDIPWPDVAIDASSSPSFFVSSSIFLPDASTTTAATNTFLTQPSTGSSQPGAGVAHSMASQGAMFDLDSDLLEQLLSSDSPGLQVATIASSSTSFFDSPSTFPLLDATTSWETPASRNNILIEPSIAVPLTTSSEDAAVEQMLTLLGDNPWPDLTTNASSPASSFPCPSTFLLDATTSTAATNTLLSQPNTCSSQPGTGVEHTMASQGAMVDLDSDDPEELFFDKNSWFQAMSMSLSGFFGSRSITALLTPSYTLADPDFDLHLDQAASLFRNNPWPELATDASILDSATPSSAKSFGQWHWTSFSVLERVTRALTYIRETQRYNSVLAQLWMPVIRRGHACLQITTHPEEMPIAIDRSSDGLIRFRGMSMIFEFFTSIENILMGVQDLDAPSFTTNYELPMILNKENSYEMPPMNVVNDLGICAAMRLPVFEKGAHLCFGVIELISTADKLNFAAELDTICSALQAVNLTTTPFSSISRIKFDTTSYEEAIPEILRVLRAVCVIHELPLAQTWATCAQQGKRCGRHSDENCRYCISTIDVACYVNDHRMQFFHKACSEQHLLPGQGVAGKAFTTNQRCFLSDIGSSSEQEYPLSHHAKIFKLKGATAIRLRCTRTGTADFVLEFFLPTDCEVENEQKTVMGYLWVTVQSLSKTLRMVTNKEMQDDPMWEMNEVNSLGLQKNKKTKRRKPMEPRSAVWKSFTKVMVGDNLKAKCDYCGLYYCCDSRNGTSSMISHLKRCKFNPSRTTGPI